MRRRRRIAVAENVIRTLFGEPQLVPAGHTVSPPSLVRERSLGPVVVRGSARLSARAVLGAEGTVVEVTVPDTPERRTAAFSMATGGLFLGGWIAEFVTDDRGTIIFCAVAGCWGGIRLWNDWVSEWDRWARSRA